MALAALLCSSDEHGGWICDIGFYAIAGRPLFRSVPMDLRPAVEFLFAHAGKGKASGPGGPRSRCPFRGITIEWVHASAVMAERLQAKSRGESISITGVRLRERHAGWDRRPVQ
jgi:hypothetical protein